MKCKDCKFLFLLDYCVGICEKYNGLNGRISPEDYCSRGETRNGKTARIDNKNTIPGTTAVLDKETNEQRD